MYGASGQVIAGNGGEGMAVSPAALAAVRRGRTTVATQADDRLRVIVACPQ